MMPEPQEQPQEGPDRFDVVAAVRAMWSGSAPPPLDQLLTPAILADEQLLADVVATDIEERRSRGLPAGLAVYVQACPGVLSHPAVRRVILMGELISRADEPLNAIRAELVRHFPQIAQDIEAVAAISMLLSGEGPASRPRHLVGTRLGKYRLDALLGAGAFAHTWLAWDESLRRHVALKLLDASHLQESEAAERVMTEARAAAGLDHAAIVRVHEAGRFPETGEFYIDAQFVGTLTQSEDRSGGIMASTRTLEDLLAKGPLEPRRAALLIAAVARGVAAAHARGITHRDIKPANILLNADDAPLLADFGLAQSEEREIAGGQEPSRASPTRRRVAGTPAYIAPEIARGEPGTPLSDMFSLGCTLRALLLGCPPRQAIRGDGKSSFAEVLLMASEQPLPPMIAGRVPATLCRICDRASAHRPEDRYASADRFAADLAAFLNHMPTQADPPGSARSAGLWLRRHRAGVTVAAVSLLLIAAATTAFVIRLSAERSRAVKAELAAEAQRDAAIAAHDTIELMNRFVSRTFNSTRGQKSTGNVTVMDAIGLASERVGRTFSNRPQVEAAVRHFLGEAAIGAGGFDAARVQLDRALQLRRTHLGESHPDTLATMRQVAELDSVTGRREQATEAYSRILGTLGEAGAIKNADGLRAMGWLGGRAMDAGKLEEAKRILEMAAAAYEQQPCDGSADQQQVLNALVQLYTLMHDDDAAVRTQRRIFELNTRNLGPDDISTLNAQQAVGSVLNAAGRREEAEAVYRDALARYHATVGRNHVASLHVTFELGMLAIPDRPLEALTLIREVREATASYNKTHVLRLRSGTMLGLALEAAGQKQEAEAALRGSLASNLEAAGPANKWTRDAANQLAKFLDRQGRPEEAAAVRAQIRASPDAAGEPAKGR